MKLPIISFFCLASHLMLAQPGIPSSDSLVIDGKPYPIAAQSSQKRVVDPYYLDGESRNLSVENGLVYLHTWDIQNDSLFLLRKHIFHFSKDTPGKLGDFSATVDSSYFCSSCDGSITVYRPLFDSISLETFQGAQVDIFYLHDGIIQGQESINRLLMYRNMYYLEVKQHQHQSIAEDLVALVKESIRIDEAIEGEFLISIDSSMVYDVRTIWTFDLAIPFYYSFRKKKLSNSLFSVLKGKEFTAYSDKIKVELFIQVNHETGNLDVIYDIIRD